MLAATMVQEAARPGTRLLLAVPAVLAGGAIGAWIRDREAGIAFPAITLALGAAAGLTLEQSPGAAALLLPASALVLTALRPVRVLLWCSLLAGATSVTGILLWLVSAHGPGEPGTVLPVRALIVTPMVFAGGVGGLLIARRYSFEDQENSYESS